jgi:hypothetical protein
MSDNNEKVTILEPSNLETIDTAVFDWVNEEINVFSNTNRGWMKIPVIWVSAERAHQSKSNKSLRDKEGALIFPIITVERTSVEKDLSFKGSLQANVFPIDDYRGGSIPLVSVINQDKTKNFQNADAKREYGQLNFKVHPKDNKIVYTHKTIPIPVYVTSMYKIVLRGEYQQQINEMSQPFMVATGGINSFILRQNGHRYEGFLQASYAQENNIADLAEEERIYQTSIEVKVLGTLIGSGNNQEKPHVVERESAVEFKFNRERTIMQDDPTHPDNWGKYRE